MALIITEVAIQADGTIAVELYNTGPGAFDTNVNAVHLQIANDGGGPSVNLPSGLVIPAGGVLTVGHSSIAGVDQSPDDTVMDDTPVDLILLLVDFVVVDHFGVDFGPDLGTDVVYEGLTSRAPDPDFNTDNTGAFTQTAGFSNNSLGTAVCFGAGTLIVTPQGTVAVETLAIGDMVVTQDGRSVPVKWIGRQTIGKLAFGLSAQTVRILAGALGGGLPHSDLTVTGDHGMILDGFVINASALVNGHSITWVPLVELPARFTVYHVETEAHDVILANGAPAETFVDIPGRMAFDNYAEYLDLYGIERIIPEMNRTRISSPRLLPDAIKVRLGIEAAATFDWSMTG